ncbi:hypothetical protein [Phycicoccus flavus]|uniref:hypothetical protein n=1 Tax=Phycicoccus flavus TaxID=2502783 RepID=UPI000FEC029D|nr:hypothetical protein [Phycicoccus flavus]NHA67274.1 hypothetical protein [Phycicoccus flavus]
MLAAVVTAGCLAALGGCGVGAQARPEILGSPTSGADGAAVGNPGVPLTVQVYLLDGDHLVPVSRTVPAGTGLAPSLSGLVQPLDRDDLGRGLRTALPAASTPPKGTMIGTVARVTMPVGFDRLSVRDQVAAMSQIVWTVTGNTLATKVRLFLGDREIPVPGGDGLLVDRPVGRDDYASWRPLGVPTT